MKRRWLLVLSAIVAISGGLLAVQVLNTRAPEQHPKDKIGLTEIKYIDHGNRLSEISGQISNHDSQTRTIKLRVLFYGPDNAVYGRARGEILGLPSDETREFKLYTTTDVGGFTRYDLQIEDIQ